MKTVFQLLDDIYYLKPSYKLQDDDQFDAYMIQRWISMQNPTYANFINELFNRNHNAFSDNQMIYDFLKCVLPKRKMPFATYFKKPAKDDVIVKNKTIIEDLAKTLEISKREIKEYLKIFPEIEKELINDSTILKKKVENDDE